MPSQSYGIDVTHVVTGGHVWAGIDVTGGHVWVEATDIVVTLAGSARTPGIQCISLSGLASVVLMIDISA